MVRTAILDPDSADQDVHLGLRTPRLGSGQFGVAREGRWLERLFWATPGGQVVRTAILGYPGRAGG